MLQIISVSILLLSLLQSFNCLLSYQPEQVHLSYGENVWELVVTWNTLNNTNASVVEFGIGGLVSKSRSVPTLFVHGGPQHRRQYIHRVRLTNLQPDSKYVYHCGSDAGWSDVFTFSVPPADPAWSPLVAVFGDMGAENAQSLPRLQEETQRGVYDAVLHVGDFAYDMDSEDGRVGDEFMRQIQSIAAYVPYMTCPGNHEEAYNFSDYRNRFSMPGSTGELFYSFNMGQVHYISISTEVYYFLKYGIKELVKQYDWLVNDLKEASSPANRSVRPWIVVFGHRPMYCSNLLCGIWGDRTREGLPVLKWFALERLFYDHGVDLEIWAHEHSYERMWPVYDYGVRNGSREEPYRNPGAPVHITTGSAGCKEGRNPFTTDQPPYSAFRSNDYGYMRLRAFNKTHLYAEQVSDDKDGEVIDHVWIIKDTHGSYEKV